MFSNKFKTELLKTIQLSVPIIVAQLGIILMAVTDNVIVGKLLGAKALGAAGIGNSVAFLIASLATGGLSVLAPMVSKLFAERDNLQLAKLFRTGFVVSLLFAITLFGLGLLVYYNFHLFNQSADIQSLASKYFLIIMASNVLLFAFIYLKQFTDGFALPKISMYITFVGLVMNAIFNYVLIQGLWGFPTLGLAGSAWATLLTRVIMTASILIYMLNNKNFKQLFKAKIPLIYSTQIKAVISKAIPSGLQFFFEIGAFTTAVIMMGWISEVALASHQIAINIASTTYMMATGIAYAGGIRVGEAWGMRSPKAIIRSGYAAYFLVFVFMAVCMIAILLLRRTLLEGYINDTAVIEAAPEGGFWATCIEIPGANGQGESVEEAKKDLIQAVELLLEDRREDMLRGLPEDVVRATILVG